MGRRQRALLVAFAVLAPGCSSVSGDYFWVDALPRPEKPDANYVIGPGDVVSVRVWGQEAMSARVRVRDDGRLTVPFVNDYPAAGLEPSDLARRLQVRLKDFIVNPVVTITVEEVRRLQIPVVGEVTRPGVYELEPGAGILKALAAAGGTTPFADDDKIFVLRKNHWADDPNRPVRIRFSFDRLVHGEVRANAFALVAGDVVVVE